MLKWSKYFQSPEYLSVYRTMTLNNDYRELISKWIGLTDGMKVLDVGCGTGAFTYYLAKGTKNCNYYGVDIDETFINNAKTLIPDNTNSYYFVLGDASELPFPDNFFDITTSYTFLTNMPNGKKAMEEMKRVTKTNGIISSITAQNFFNSSKFDGDYPITHSNYYHEYKVLKEEFEKVYEQIQPVLDYIKYGTAPEIIPRLYVQSNLRDIKMYPLGWSYSLSNDVQSKEDKKCFIKTLTVAEKNKALAFSELPEFYNYISRIKLERYLELLEIREKTLLESLGENAIWEWEGGSQLLMVARVE